MKHKLYAKPTPTAQNFRIGKENTEKACNFALEPLKLFEANKKHSKYHLLQ
jgi:hypothetical protein